MANSVLAYDEAMVKEFGIKNDLELVHKIGYVRGQLDEFKKVLWRNRVDAGISQYLLEKAKAKGDEALEGKFMENLNRYRNDIRQINSSVEFLESMLAELSVQFEKQREELADAPAQQASSNIS